MSKGGPQVSGTGVSETLAGEPQSQDTRQTDGCSTRTVRASWGDQMCARI